MTNRPAEIPPPPISPSPKYPHFAKSEIPSNRPTEIPPPHFAKSEIPSFRHVRNTLKSAGRNTPPYFAKSEIPSFHQVRNTLKSAGQNTPPPPIHFAKSEIPSFRQISVHTLDIMLCYTKVFSSKDQWYRNNGDSFKAHPYYHNCTLILFIEETRFWSHSNTLFATCLRGAPIQFIFLFVAHCTTVFVIEQNPRVPYLFAAKYPGTVYEK